MTSSKDSATNPDRPLPPIHLRPTGVGDPLPVTETRVDDPPYYINQYASPSPAPDVSPSAAVRAWGVGRGGTFDRLSISTCANGYPLQILLSLDEDGGGFLETSLPLPPVDETQIATFWTREEGVNQWPLEPPHTDRLRFHYDRKTARVRYRLRNVPEFTAYPIATNTLAEVTPDQKLCGLWFLDVNPPLPDHT